METKETGAPPRRRRFGGNEDGAISVDWVLLTALVAGFGLAVAAAIEPAAETHVQKIPAAVNIATSF
ncbi:MAG: hypothetical protein D6832_05490 [Alphaproteobacteria bacterium]|nr:MAG: hypothetical protein D6832_05490 [Alphaproteobacteria bacterium]